MIIQQPGKMVALALTRTRSPEENAYFSLALMCLDKGKRGVRVIIPFKGHLPMPLTRVYSLDHR